MTAPEHHGVELGTVTFPEDALAADPDEPAGSSYDPVAQLTIDELQVGNRQLKASVVQQITGKGDRYEQALALVLWLHRRRADPRASLAEVYALTFDAMTDQLAALGPDTVGPTPPGP